MPKRTRRRERRSATAPRREWQRLVSYLPTDEQPATTEEAAKGKLLPHPRAPAPPEPKHLTRDYSYVPAEVRRVLVLTLLIVALLVALAIVLR